MSTTTIKLAGKTVRLESSAYSLILYEDEFKRNFLKDYENILGIVGDVDFGNYVRFLWLFTQNSNEGKLPFDKFAEKLEIGDVIENLSTIVSFISDSIASKSVSKKGKAAAALNFIRHPKRFLQQRHRTG